MVLSVISLIWIINFSCIIVAARKCSFELSHFVLYAALLGPLAWIAVCLNLRQLPPGRVSALPSPFRQVMDVVVVWWRFLILALFLFVVTFCSFDLNHGAAGVLCAR